MIEKLQNEILLAVQDYKTRYPRRAASAHRRINIEYITNLCKVDPTATSQEKLLSDLENYFSDGYSTGLRDRSALEDLIVQAVLNVNTDMQLGLNTFGYFPKDHPQPEKTPDGAQDGFITLEYTLDDFINFAIDKYTEEKEGKIAEYRQSDIQKIKEILNLGMGSSDKVKLIRKLLKAFTHSCNSNLKEHIFNALDNFASYPSKEIATRIWDPEQPSNPEKIMIFLHGWHDSVNSGDELAQEAVKRGFKVIAYDHRGHGKDAQRKERGITIDLLRIDFRKFLTDVKSKYPIAELALAGHSMGGGILAAENKFIKKEKSIKSISLICPAVMSGLSKMISPIKILYRNMHPNVQAAQQGSHRFGGKGPTLFGLLNFMRKAARALASLFSEPENPEQTWRIYSGKKDASVNYREFVLLSNQNNIKFFSRGDHALQFGRHAGAVNRKILDDIAVYFSGRQDMCEFAPPFCSALS